MLWQRWQKKMPNIDVTSSLLYAYQCSFRIMQFRYYYKHFNCHCALLARQSTNKSMLPSTKKQKKKIIQQVPVKFRRDQYQLFYCFIIILLLPLIHKNKIDPMHKRVRIQKQIRQFDQNPKPNICLLSYDPTEAKGLVIHAGIIGPKGSLYEHRLFPITITLKDDYPFRPPAISFDTAIYNPNIQSPHRLCQHAVSELGDQYTPQLSLCEILVFVSELLVEPYPRVDNCGNKDAIKTYNSDIKEFQRKAIESAEKHGIDLRNL